MWQQPSKRRTASGQWLQEEESLAAVIARQYHALPEPDESDKKTFDLHFAGTNSIQTNPDTSSTWSYDVTVTITPVQ